MKPQTNESGVYMNLLTKLTDSEIFEYMEGWKDHEGWSDFNIMINKGADYLMADWLVSAGAINPNTCYPQYRELEQAVLDLAKDYRKLSKLQKAKLFHSTFNGVHTYSCEDCNHVSFVTDGNERLYAKELEKCWKCGSDNIEHSIMAPEIAESLKE